MRIAVSYSVNLTPEQVENLYLLARASGFNHPDPTTGKMPTKRQLIQRVLQESGDSVIPRSAELAAEGEVK